LMTLSSDAMREPSPRSAVRAAVRAFTAAMPLRSHWIWTRLASDGSHVDRRGFLAPPDRRRSRAAVLGNLGEIHLQEGDLGGRCAVQALRVLAVMAGR
jgi:hypothetical protein